MVSIHVHIAHTWNLEIPRTVLIIVLTLHTVHDMPGEDLWQTAIRETPEEMGINTEFVAILTFHHMHEYRWGTSDLYFSCLLRPLNSDITVNPSEISDATWMDVRKAAVPCRSCNHSRYSIVTVNSGILPPKWSQLHRKV